MYVLRSVLPYPEQEHPILQVQRPGQLKGTMRVYIDGEPTKQDIDALQQYLSLISLTAAAT